MASHIFILRCRSSSPSRGCTLIRTRVGSGPRLAFFLMSLALVRLRRHSTSRWQHVSSISQPAFTFQFRLAESKEEPRRHSLMHRVSHAKLLNDLEDAVLCNLLEESGRISHSSLLLLPVNLRLVHGNNLNNSFSHLRHLLSVSLETLVH